MQAILCLGSNEGDTLTNIPEAVGLLIETDGIDPAGMGGFYETEPVGVIKDQEWFLNSAVAITTTLSPHDLLARVKEIEVQMGRTSGPVDGPRIIDIDIALYDDQIIETEKLTIPHPRLHERRFALQPICDIDATLKHAKLGKRLDELLASIPTDGQKMREVGP